MPRPPARRRGACWLAAAAALPPEGCPGAAAHAPSVSAAGAEPGTLCCTAAATDCGRSAAAPHTRAALGRRETRAAAAAPTPQHTHGCNSIRSPVRECVCKASLVAATGSPRQGLPGSGVGVCVALCRCAHGSNGTLIHREISVNAARGTIRMPPGWWGRQRAHLRNRRRDSATRRGPHPCRLRRGAAAAPPGPSSHAWCRPQPSVVTNHAARSGGGRAARRKSRQGAPAGAECPPGVSVGPGLKRSPRGGRALQMSLVLGAAQVRGLGSGHEAASEQASKGLGTAGAPAQGAASQRRLTVC